MQKYIKEILRNLPSDWLKFTTHRLDIYNEKLAKVQFLQEFEALVKDNNFNLTALSSLPTAYDYIRLGHPLSCILEWAIANKYALNADNVISFSSSTTPLLAVLRKNHLDDKNSRIVYTSGLPESFDAEVIRKIYGYKFDLEKIEKVSDLSEFNGSTIYISQEEGICNFNQLDQPSAGIDFYINLDSNLGSVLLVDGDHNQEYISEIQHVRRRETIAMTPINCVAALQSFVEEPSDQTSTSEDSKAKVLSSIQEITGTNSIALVASSGLSIQYAILMGLIHDAVDNHEGKSIKIVVPPNCYGGTNDQARRVAACIDSAEVIDLPVDGGNDMVESIDLVLDRIAAEDAVPYIIAEIPTNPRVEVPDLNQLREVLSKKRISKKGGLAVDPVFILDQTFCPNVHFLGQGAVLSSVRAISFASGSKFPSGGLCTAGYCVANTMAEDLIVKIGLHLDLCDNEATFHQYEILAKQLPSMNQRIASAYKNTREFVTFIEHTLPGAKINFVSEELAKEGFTPSVFSLDLPTKGESEAEKEAYKRKLNLKLINLMISKIPNESKFCVSYGQLKGCYWTIPATSTQGTTKEGDKDYIVRASLSPDLDLELHKKVFKEFVEEI